jgi:hypothetical protein
MNATLDGPAPFFSQPGPDQRTRPVSEVVDELLMLFGADRQITPDEIREWQRLMSGMQAIAQQHAAMNASAQGQQGMSGETSGFGEGEGVEPVGGGYADPNVSYMQG